MNYCHMMQRTKDRCKNRRDIDRQKRVRPHIHINEFPHNRSQNVYERSFDKARLRTMFRGISHMVSIFGLKCSVGI